MGASAEVGKSLSQRNDHRHGRQGSLERLRTGGRKPIRRLLSQSSIGFRIANCISITGWDDESDGPPRPVTEIRGAFPAAIGVVAIEHQCAPDAAGLAKETNRSRD